MSRSPGHAETVDIVANALVELRANPMERLPSGETSEVDERMFVIGCVRNFMGEENMPARTAAWGPIPFDQLEGAIQKRALSIAVAEQRESREES